MKRSEINALIADAVDFFGQHNCFLPAFAYWTPQVWARKKGQDVVEIVENDLGWDLTDYGLGEFRKYGLLLFTLRNGRIVDWQKRRGKPYAEKVMIAEVDQMHQMHFHGQKVEDIINRAGGTLAIELYNATENEQLADTPVMVRVDGILHNVPAGCVIRLHPGESVTLYPRMYHRFWSEGSRVMMGEVSTTNDDKADNYFYQPMGTGRFGKIEEDEPPLYLLCTDYARFFPSAEKKVITDTLMNPSE